MRVVRHRDAATLLLSRGGQTVGVDVAPRRRGRPAKAAKRGRPRKGSQDVGLREI